MFRSLNCIFVPEKALNNLSEGLAHSSLSSDAGGTNFIGNKRSVISVPRFSCNTKPSLWCWRTNETKKQRQ